MYGAVWKSCLKFAERCPWISPIHGLSSYIKHTYDCLILWCQIWLISKNSVVFSGVFLSRILPNGGSREGPEPPLFLDQNCWECPPSLSPRSESATVSIKWASIKLSYKVLSIEVLFYLVWSHPWTLVCRWVFRKECFHTWHHKCTGSACSGSRCTCGRWWGQALYTCKAPGMAWNNYHNDCGTTAGTLPWWSSEQATRSQQSAPVIWSGNDCFSANKGFQRHRNC